MQDPSGTESFAKDSRPPTALVLTPSVGGSFFEDVLTGLMREIFSAGGNLILIETRQKFSDTDEEGIPSDFGAPVAWAKTDGIITVTTAVGDDYVDHARAAAKPVVLLSTPPVSDSATPLVRPDNRSGARMAVEHLVEHGHTRIGFVGNRAHYDVQERFEGYEETLHAHGLKVDPRLVYHARNNSVTAGRLVAQELLSSSTRPTALVVATDNNAIGLIAALSDSGLRVPRDLAIVSFDNAMGGTLETPTLSSVELRFDRVGALAGRTLLDSLNGENTAGGVISPEVAVLMCRESCGCGADVRYGQIVATDVSGGQPKVDFRARLTDILEIELYTGDQEADAQAAVVIGKVVRDAAELLELGNGATAARIRSFTSLLLKVAKRPDTVRRVVNVMTEPAHWLETHIAPDQVARAAVPHKVVASLWKAQAASLLRHADAYNEAIADQFAVDAGMLAPSGTDPRDLRWLSGTSAKAGALALWSDSEPGERLTIVGEYHEDDQPLGIVGRDLATEEFPPDELVQLANPAKHEACVIVPVHTPEKDWGMLAIIVPIDPSVIRDTHQHWGAMLSAALESQSRQEEVRRSALFDSLTGLPNRQLFREQLEKAIERRTAVGTPFAVLFLDLDGFKLINDSLGHQMGDEVLKKVATEITGTLRAGDTAARFGGDEFVILLADTNPDQAKQAAVRIQQALKSNYVVDGNEVVTRASIGIASSAVEYHTADAVLRDADAAMYRAKSGDPGSIEYFDAPMHQTTVERNALAQNLFAALRRDEFEVHYQPIVNLETGYADRFEALVRWRHPERGLLEPGEFLPIMEHTSLIVQLGHRVLDEVCRQLAEWGPLVKNVSVNISEKEFWSQHLLLQVQEALDKHGVSADRLALEITEGVVMRRPELALRLMNEIHAAGLSLHIDDFGTGYSSVEMLQRFPVAAFKIDRSFIENLTTTDNSSALVSSLVQLGEALGLSVVAEGVETEAQRESLRELGCETAQGFLFMPAVTGERVKELLGRPLFDGESD